MYAFWLAIFWFVGLYVCLNAPYIIVNLFRGGDDILAIFASDYYSRLLMVAYITATGILLLT